MKYQAFALQSSKFISLLFFIASTFFLLAPTFAEQILFNTKNENEKSSNETLVIQLMGGILMSFSFLTLMMNWKPNFASNDRFNLHEYEIYDCRLALIAQTLASFMCVMSIMRSNLSNSSESSNANNLNLLAAGCFLMILSSVVLMTSFCFSTENQHPFEEGYQSFSRQTDYADFPDIPASTRRSFCCKFRNRIRWPRYSNFTQDDYEANTIPLLEFESSQDEEDVNYIPSDSRTSADDINSSSNEINRLQGVRRILQLASPQKFTLFSGCIVLLIRLPFSLSIPHLVSSTIGALSRNDYDSAKKSICLIMILGTVDAVLDFWCVYLFGGAKERMVKSLRVDTFKAILGQEMAYFDKVHTGELTSRLTSDCGEMAGDLTWFFRFSIEATVRIAGISLYMLIRCPPLGCTALSIIPVVALANKKYGNWLAKNATAVQTALAEANNVAQEALTCIRTVISFATEDVECKKYDDKIEAHFRLNMSQLFATGVYYMVISTFFINTCIQATLLFVGANLIKDNKLTAEVLLAFMLYQGQLQEYTLQFFQSYTSLIKSSGAGEKVFAILDRFPTPPGTNFSKTFSTATERNETSLLTSNQQDEIENEIHNAMAINREITLSHLHFTYPLRRNQIILQNLNLKIPSGSTVALVGPSGCGKSTIVSLLERFYDPSLGQILVDGIDLRNLSIRDFRRRVGIVAQDPILFSGTILSNILYGSQSVTRSEAIEAAKLANVHSFVNEFPLGYDTEVGEKGVQLSGGQKQRIAIARAVAKKPSLLLLDEATSALDQDSERLVQEAIDALLMKRDKSEKIPKKSVMTTLVVAHRLQTVRNADEIIVMQPGLGVVEKGNHDSLMQKSDGYYRRMIMKSSSHEGVLNDDFV